MVLGLKEGQKTRFGLELGLTAIRHGFELYEYLPKFTANSSDICFAAGATCPAVECILAVVLYYTRRRSSTLSYFAKLFVTRKIPVRRNCATIP